MSAFKGLSPHHEYYCAGTMPSDKRYFRANQYVFVSEKTTDFYSLLDSGFRLNNVYYLILQLIYNEIVDPSQ
jgi:hypothetical protein